MDGREVSRNAPSARPADGGSLHAQDLNANAGLVPAFRVAGLVWLCHGEGMLGRDGLGSAHVSNDQSLQTQLRDAVARGDTQAIAALMRQGGLTGLLQALRAVQASAVQQSMQASATSKAVQVPTAVHAAMKQGNLLEAVKSLRQANPGLSLRAAKEHVEALRIAPPKRPVERAATTFASTRVRTPTVVMGDKPGSLRWLFVVIAFAALAWWWSTT